MSKNSQINIRFDAETEAALNEICLQLGVSKSALVRRLTEKFILEVRMAGGIKIAASHLNTCGPADARTPWGEAKMQKVAEGEEEFKSPESKPVNYREKQKKPKL